MIRPAFIIRLLALAACWASADAEPVPRMLPGELSADEILNGAYPFPAFPGVPSLAMPQALPLNACRKFRHRACIRVSFSVRKICPIRAVV